MFRSKFLAKGFRILKKTYDMKDKDQNKKASILEEAEIPQGKEKNGTHHLSSARTMLSILYPFLNWVVSFTAVKF